jgi:DNA repair protein RecO (recombination protein O)
MATTKDRAFVLDAADYRETSTLLRLLCEREGRVALVARGLRSEKSRKGAAAQPFNLVQVTYSLREGATMGNLAAIDLERQPQRLRERLDAYAVAAFWFETVNVSAPARLPAGEMFGLTGALLLALETEPVRSVRVLWMWFRLLDALGFGASVGACGSCGRGVGLMHFDMRQCCAVCSRCAQSGRRYFPLPEAAPALLAALDGREVPAAGVMGDAAGNALYLLLHDLLARHLDTAFRSHRFLAEMLGMRARRHPPARRAG